MAAGNNSGFIDMVEMLRKRAALVVERHSQASASANETDRPALNSQDAQIELFRLFELLFASVTGMHYTQVPGSNVLKDIVIARVRAIGQPAFAEQYNKIAEELAEFYEKQAIHAFTSARESGGLKLVLGGQRSFQHSALGSVRIAGLYADTQLIPDPIFPFFRKRKKGSTSIVFQNIHAHCPCRVNKTPISN